MECSITTLLMNNFGIDLSQAMNSVFGNPGRSKLFQESNERQLPV
jgi:hypothetical protein